MFILKNVRYKNIINIDELNISEGKTTCILGKSGGGKTTLLKLLNKMISCEEGEIYYKNKLIEDWDSVYLRREVVMLPQNPIMFNGNVRENLLIGLKFSEKPLVSDKRLIETLDIVELNKSLDDDTLKLSGGEKQRVALARVLLLEPEVYLLDEPSSALDEGTEEKIIGKIVDEIKRKGKTLIMVTHSKNIAKNFAEEVIRVENGKVIRGEK